MSGDVVLKVDRLETHDRLLEYTKQKDYISEGIRECILNRPEEFGNRPFYVFAHLRTHENGYLKRLVWQPRLKKPKSQTNSMLFKAYPPSDKIKVIWMIPERSQWGQYQRGNITQDDLTVKSIMMFQTDRETLERKEEDDLEDFQIDDIYIAISANLQFKNGKQTCDLAKMN